MVIRDIIVLISCLILFVSISFLVNIGKEMSLSGFRRNFSNKSPIRLLNIPQELAESNPKIITNIKGKAGQTYLNEQ